MKPIAGEALVVNDSIIEEHRAVRQGAGLIRLSERGKVKVQGPDAVTFLHSMISNDVESLAPLSGCYAALLTAKGKIVADFFVYRLDSFLLLDIPTQTLATAVSTLEKYIIMDDVELTDVSGEWSHYSLQGRSSADVILRLSKDVAPLPSPLHLRSIDWDGHPIWIIGKPELSEQGFELLVPAAAADPFAEALLEAGRDDGLKAVGAQAREILRVEAGLAVSGKELDSTRYPMEARLDHAISFDKGCYIGQEVVAKATYVGGVARLLVRLRFGGDQVPPPGTTLKNEAGRRVGTITSSVFSLDLQCPIALAYLRRAAAKVGTRLTAEVDGQGTLEAEVVERFSNSPA